MRHLSGRRLFCRFVALAWVLATVGNAVVGMPPAAYLSRGVHAADKSDPCLVRGGETELDAKFPSISNFLTTEEREQALENFHIHGWRWHTSSLIREARRFCTLAQRAQSAQGDDALNSIAEALQAAAEYVIGFNMKGLHRIEADLMFPWMREKLTKTESIPREASDGFAVAMTQLENDRKQLTNIGESIIESVADFVKNQSDSSSRSQALQQVVESTAALQQCAIGMEKLENELLVPAIAKVVPASEQHSFNNRVLRNLGLWDSRLYLVAMYEAVEESGDKQEKALFEQSIPSIPQKMIPRWRRKLYIPRTGVLDTEL